MYLHPHSKFKFYNMRRTLSTLLLNMLILVFLLVFVDLQMFQSSAYTPETLQRASSAYYQSPSVVILLPRYTMSADFVSSLVLSCVSLCRWSSSAIFASQGFLIRTASQKNPWPSELSKSRQNLWNAIGLKWYLWTNQRVRNENDFFISFRSEYF